MFGWLISLLMLPIELLRSVTELVEFSAQNLFIPRVASANDDEAPRPWWLTVILLPVLVPIWILRACLAIVTLPMAIAEQDNRRRAGFFLGLPSLIIFLGVVAGFTYTAFNRKTIEMKYRIRMQNAITDKDFKLASLLGERLIQESPEKDPQMQLTYASILSQSGNKAKASKILNDLAPDDKVGFAVAHRIRAKQFAAQLNQSISEVNLKGLNWHLENSGTENSEELESLWAFYYSRLGQTDEVIKHLEIAARINPSYFLSLAELYKQSGNAVGAKRSLVAAEEIFEKASINDPLSKQARMALVATKIQLQKFDDAEKLIVAGLKIQSDDVLLRAGCDLYIIRYDAAMRDGLAFEKQFSYLQKAIAMNNSHPSAYDRLVSLYSKSGSTDDRDKIIKSLQDMITEGKSAALAHFALSSILFVHGREEEGQWHLRQSFKLDPGMAVVCNNLAWVMLMGDEEQWDEALSLATQAVQSQPDSANFRDTLGTALMRKERYEEAIVEFERILLTIADKKSVHKKLATCYTEIGQLEMANSHAEWTPSSKN